MFTTPMSRRSFIGALSATCASPAALARPAALFRFGRISVDAHALSARGLVGLRSVVERAAASELEALFADRRGGQVRLVARIDAISTGSDVMGRIGHRGSGNLGNDYIEGAAIVLGPGGQLIASYPILAVISSGASGPWYVQDMEPRRFDLLGRHFARWVRRVVG